MRLEDFDDDLLLEMALEDLLAWVDALEAGFPGAEVMTADDRQEIDRLVWTAPEKSAGKTRGAATPSSA